MRLVTRGDLDGLTSAVIITMKEPIGEILLVHPQDITDQSVEIRGDDVLANLPYDPRCGKWFDHHLLTDSNQKPPAQFDGRHRLAPSAARLVYEYYLEREPQDEA
ncbi:MAG TPA: exopolyphosphatase, partial [Thermoanaerobaculia bacterium]